MAPAIRDARQNARDNHIQNVDFLCGDAAREMPELVKNGSRPDVVVLDPPRAGCEQRVLDAIAKVRPHRVVYVSCNPASLARDAAILRDRGFVVRKVQPVDMFPHTSHVESVALLTYTPGKFPPDESSILQKQEKELKRNEDSFLLQPPYFCFFPQQV